MKQYVMNKLSQRFATITACLLACSAMLSSHADVVFQADFDSASQMVSLGGTGTLDSRPNAVASIATDKPLADGAGGYLSIATTAATHTAEAVFKPASAGSSLGAMTSVHSGDCVINGGLDFFFRSGTDLTQTEQFRPIDSNNRDQDGLRLVLLSVGSDQMRVEVLSPPNGILQGGEGGKATHVIAAHGKTGPIKADTLYHVGVTFETDPNGNVTLSLWVTQGDGEIDVMSDPPVATTVFGINEKIVKNGFTSGAFSFGKLNVAGSPTTQDFDTFRLYNDTPMVFEALTAPEPAAQGLLGFQSCAR